MLDWVLINFAIGFYPMVYEWLFFSEREGNLKD